MSLTFPNNGGSMTGGSSAAATYAGSPQPGRSSYLLPGHTRLTPRTLDVFVTQAKTTAQDPGVARAGFKITIGDRTTEEGCCTVRQGDVIVDCNVRWSLNQSGTLVDAAIDYLQSMSFHQALVDAIKNGVPPS